MNNKLFEQAMTKTYLTILLLTALCFVGCENAGKNSVKEIDNDSTFVCDSLSADTAEYVGSGKGLNDIRFANFDENDWLDNEYIRCLRRYLDDYNSGKIKNEYLDQYKEKLKGKFVILWAEPYMAGGMFIQFIFIEYPEDIFTAWVYSGVDEEKELVLDYEMRSISLDEEKSDFTKEEILDIVKEHPELKLW